MVEALTPCTKQPQKQDVRFRQTTAAMLEVLTYTPSIAEVRMHIHTDARARQMYVHRQLTICHSPKSLPGSPQMTIICTRRPEMNNVSTVITQHCISNHFSLAEVRMR